jgi:hypothetical protein
MGRCPRVAWASGEPSVQDLSLRIFADQVDEFEPVLHADLLVNVVDMIPDRARGDEKLFGDVLIVRSLEDEAEDLSLPRRDQVFFDEFI